MSLTDPTKKMSKSDSKPKSRILITDSREDIHSKVKTALTDSIQGVTYDRENRPGVSNLVDLKYYFDETRAASPQELAKHYESLHVKILKEDVTESIDAGISKIRDRYQELMSGNQKELVEIAEQGAKKAEVIAESTMERVRNAMGIGW
jgi:tryptophanyl-tRNA synthetase